MRIKQKTPKKSDHPYEGAVHTRNNKGVLSIEEAKIREELTADKNNRTNLMEEIISDGNLLQALKQVQRNGGAPGIDGMDCEYLGRWFRKHRGELKRRLLNGEYEPTAVRRVNIPKASGKGARPLGIPTVKDRLVQQAMLQVLQRKLDGEFSESSYGFRPSRSAKQAITKAREYAREGKRIVVDIDLSNFFNEVNQDKLMHLLSLRIGDKRVLLLIRKYLRSGVMINGCKMKSDKGTPQGGPLSPLLSNVMLDVLDKELEKRGHKFCRYADDANIYVSTWRGARRVFKSICLFIENKLKLKVNYEKSKIARVWKTKFLGFSLTNRKEAKIRIAPEALKKFKERVRKLTSRTQGISTDTRITRLNLYLVGWIGYFGVSETETVTHQLHSWIQRRLRLCEIRKWKTGKTRFKNLVRLGIDKENAAILAGSSKGWWRLSLTPQIHTALGSDYWAKKGLRNIHALHLGNRKNL
jgi:RNA-directed DNA polymerase